MQTFPSRRQDRHLVQAMLAGAIVAVLALPVHAGSGQDQGHSHGHNHGHSHEQVDEQARRIHQGHFDDAQVQARPLSDWAGEWQSVYPLLMAGQLDQVMSSKAEKGDKTAAEYRRYYETGYRTDVDRIAIDGDRVTFRSAKGSASARYVSDGFEILTYPKGNRGVRYVFRKTEGDAAAPDFIQFSDHKIAPQAADHYHLYWGNDRAAILRELTNWPTYYPATLSPAQIVQEMLAH